METDKVETSPIKFFSAEREVKVKDTQCLICGRWTKKQSLRVPKEQGISTFIKSLKIRRKCNGFDISKFENFIDLENNTWIKDKEMLRWHPGCYSNFCNCSNLISISTRTNSFSEECSSTSGSEKPVTRNNKSLMDLRNVCMFCGFKKYHGDTKLKLLQYQNVIDNIKPKCNEKKTTI